MNSLLEPTTLLAASAAGPAPLPGPALEQPSSPPAPVPPAPPGWFAWACPCCQATLRTVTTARRGSCPACGSLIEAPDPPAAPEGATTKASVAWPPAGVASWLRRHGWLSLAVGGALLAVSGGALLLARTQPWNWLLRSTAMGQSNQPPVTKGMREKLDRFLQAPDWAAKRTHVLDASRLDRSGAAYYQGRDPEEIKAADFHPWAMPGLHQQPDVAVLRADRPGRRPVLAIFRQADRGWHLDWEMFCQSYDEALPAFLATPSFPVRTFRTRLNRVFPADSTDGTFAVQISDLLDPGQRITMHLPTGTPIMQAIAGGLSGTQSREATVEVCWARPHADGDWVPMLQRLVCWGWHGLNGLPETAAPSPPPTEHFITPAAAPLSSPPPPAENVLTATPAVASQ